MKSILLVKKFLGLVEMTSGLVNASFSLPEWQAVKMIFFAPCQRVGISLVEVLERVGKLSFCSVEDLKLKSLTEGFYGCVKIKKTSWVSD